MKLETLGWWLFLVSAIVFAVTCVYALGSLVLRVIWDLLRTYNNNTHVVIGVTFVTAIVGVILIKAGSGRTENEI